RHSSMIPLIKPGSTVQTNEATSFLAIYKYLPKTRTYWSDVWLGAIIAGALFELTKSAFILYLDTIARYDQLYGSVASIIILMVWTYISALILIVGAEFASEYGRMKRGTQRGENSE
ncbi:MAG: YihY/virulence factor BrkB family protein, partial [Chloroflexi bacterium]|nr:YihY/virulence factor BrkB family protein [Chloroflexota bacterium]